MDLCICCRQSCRKTWLLEVQTLHIRDLSGEKRVQALGRIITAGVCDACAAQQLANMKDPGVRLYKSVGGYMALAIIGGTLFFFLTDLPLRIACAAAVVLGVLGTVITWRRAKQTKKHLAGLRAAEALEQARWQRMISALPQKSEDSDLTYLPMTPALAHTEPMTLVEQYDLLPPIAKLAIKQAKERYSPEGMAQAEKAAAEAATQ